MSVPNPRRYKLYVTTTEGGEFLPWGFMNPTLDEEYARHEARALLAEPRYDGYHAVAVVPLTEHWDEIEVFHR